MAFFVMTKTVLRSLFSKPVTVRYPFGPATHKEKTRGHIQIDIKACIFCGMCQRKCPTGALLVRREQKEWEIDRLRCISCNACVEVCPKKCLAMGNTYTPPSTQRQKEIFRDA